MKTMKRLLVLLMAVILIAGAAACGADTAPAPAPETQPGDVADSEGNGIADTPTEQPSEASPSVTVDREGNPVTLPDTIETIISMGPANTEILVALGFADRIIAIDEFSENIPGLPVGIPQFDMMAPDAEQILALTPDVVFMPGMTIDAGGADPFQMIRDAGITVIFIPTSSSIAGIMDDIRFFGGIMGANELAEKIITQMDSEIEEFREIGRAITERRTVYFELSPAPWMVSLGRDTFLNEMIEIIGAVNVFADLDSWTSIADEALLLANPDVILTSVNFIDDPIGEIMSRPGWGAITAVNEGAVFIIDTDASNRPSHNIVIALREMAQAVYPEYF